MISQLKISILVDNVSDNPGFKGEHGLSLFIEADNHRILFDTGQSDILFDNACQLGIDLSTADTIVLSHGHYDHTGGVAKVLEINRTASVYCHSEVLVPRYSQQDDGRMKLIGIDAGSSEALYSAFDRLLFVNTPVYLSENIGITGPSPE